MTDGETFVRLLLLFFFLWKWFIQSMKQLIDICLYIVFFFLTFLQEQKTNALCSHKNKNYGNGFMDFLIRFCCLYVSCLPISTAWNFFLRGGAFELAKIYATSNWTYICNLCEFFPETTNLLKHSEIASLSKSIAIRNFNLSWLLVYIRVYLGGGIDRCPKRDIGEPISKSIQVRYMHVSNIINHVSSPLTQLWIK